MTYWVTVDVSSVLRPDQSPSNPYSVSFPFQTWGTFRAATTRAAAGWWGVDNGSAVGKPYPHERWVMDWQGRRRIEDDEQQSEPADLSWLEE